MNGTPNDTNTTAATISWRTKAKYVGTGLVVGVIIAPLVREVLAKVKPKIDKIFEDMTGTTEGYVEKASDLLFKAKEHLHNHGDHDHGPRVKPTVKPTKREDGRGEQFTS